MVLSTKVLDFWPGRRKVSNLENTYTVRCGPIKQGILQSSAAYLILTENRTKILKYLRLSWKATAHNSCSLRGHSAVSASLPELTSFARWCNFSVFYFYVTVLWNCDFFCIKFQLMHKQKPGSTTTFHTDRINTTSCEKWLIHAGVVNKKPHWTTMCLLLWKPLSIGLPNKQCFF